MGYNKNSQLKILMLGYIVRGPLGGMVWHHFQYVLGLRQMGHRVHYVEDSGDDEYCCYNPENGTSGQDPSHGLTFIQSIFDAFDISEQWAYYDKHHDQWHGKLSSNRSELFQDYDILINLSCSNTIRTWWSYIPVKVVVDTDPVFTQIRNLTDPARRALTEKHNVFLTFGENYGIKQASIPEDGFPWWPTRQPIVLSAWPETAAIPEAKFTTVMQWESYPSREYQGLTYGQKSESFIAYLNLPAMISAEFEIAMGSENAPRDIIRKHGWTLSNPLTVAADAWKYQKYIQGSRGEFSVSKHGYVVTKSGWFSERSAAYLASGRPVIVQDTGFSTHIQAGLGLMAFSNIEEAVDAINMVNSDYREHCRAAREIANDHFNSSSILGDMLDYAMRTRSN